MTALPNVANVLRIQFQQSMAADLDVLNRMYFSFTGSTTNAILTTAASTIATAWSTTVAPNLHTSNVLTAVHITDLTNLTAPAITEPTSQAGGVSGTSTPAGVAMLVNFHIARRYRGGKPRWYQAGLPDSAKSTDQTWSSGAQSSYLSGLATLISDVLGSGTSGLTITAHVNVSYYEGFRPVTYPSGRVKNVPTLRATPVVDSVTGQNTNPNFASQRRRNLIP